MRKKTIKSLLLFALIIFMGGTAYSQTKITGTVLDETNMGLPGVNIKIKGTSTGVITDLDGNYTINAPKDGTLEFSFMGYETQILKIEGKAIINVNMKPSAQSIGEVVVVGYGTQKRGNVTGAVTSVDTKVLEDRPITNIEEALQGQVAGLSISSTGGQPGAESKMNIRGITSVSGSSQPLIVIDGFPINEVSTSGGGGLEANSSQMSSLAFINPDDIEAIEVLKDASATAIYGNRGANGVIMITTKSGLKGTSGITYSGYYGIQEMKKRVETLNFSQYVDLQQKTNFANKLFTAEDGSYYQFSDADAAVMFTDWQSEIFRRGLTQNHSLSMQGSSQKTSYTISASYNRVKSILIETDFKKFTTRMSVKHQFSDKVTIGTNMSYSNIAYDGVPTDGREGTGAGVVITAMGRAPFTLDENTAARFRRAGVQQVHLGSRMKNDFGDPINIARNTDLDKTINRSITNSYVNFEILDWLSFRSTVGIDMYNLKDNQFYSTNTPWGRLNNGIATNTGINAMSLANEDYFTIAKTIGAHNINFMTGVSFQRWDSERFKAEGRDFSNEALGYYVVNLGAEQIVESSADETFMASYLARTNYSYGDRYLATLSFRRDGTSRFVNTKWGNFYSGALGWNIKNEEFLKNVDLVSVLKVRGSYGQVGNSGVPAQGAQLYLNGDYSFNGKYTKGVYPSQLENNDLSWETTQQLNLGLDVGVLDKKLNFTADYYQTHTKDLLLFTPVSVSTGFTKGWFNIGELANKGFEFSISYALETGSGFSWNTSLNVTQTQNEVLALGVDDSPIYIDVNFDNICKDEVILQIGGSINDMYGYKTDGVYVTEDFNEVEDDEGNIKLVLKEDVAGMGAGEKPGDLKYKDLNNDSIIDADDRTIIGNALPEFYGSWSNSFSYKGISLDIVMQYSYGNDIFNATLTRNARFQGGGGNVPTFWLDRWTPENPNSTQYARIASLNTADFFIEDGSFIRLQTLRLGYDIPKVWAAKIKAKSIKVYVSATNLALFTKYSGYDPEVSTNKNYSYPFVQGFDYGGFPRPKTFIAGLNIQF
jgi:TonB-linked SusC/RagA family outer membrane protein